VHANTLTQPPCFLPPAFLFRSHMAAPSGRCSGFDIRHAARNHTLHNPYDAARGETS
ncbi:unnamed protein product, partial [Closterium sp. Naga37s-1]